MGGALTITVRSERGVVIAAVTGEIDISTVAQLRERPVRAGGQRRDAHRGPEPVTFIDSAGLGALVVTACRAAAHGRSLHAVCARPQTRKLLWMTGVDRRIPLTATVDGALMLMAASRDSSVPVPDQAAKILTLCHDFENLPVMPGDVHDVNRRLTRSRYPERLAR